MEQSFLISEKMNKNVLICVDVPRSAALYSPLQWVSSENAHCAYSLQMLGNWGTYCYPKGGCTGEKGRVGWVEVEQWRRNGQKKGKTVKTRKKKMSPTSRGRQTVWAEKSETEQQVRSWIPNQQFLDMILNTLCIKRGQRTDSLLTAV